MNLDGNRLPKGHDPASCAGYVYEAAGSERVVGGRGALAELRHELDSLGLIKKAKGGRDGDRLATKVQVGSKRADPRFVETPVERLLSADYLGGRRGLIQPDRALDNPPAGRVYGDTTYLTVVDRDRNAVSLITSISDVFGSGIIVPGTGIILHNRGADFEMDAAHPNHAAPGKRVRHTIIPSMMLAPDGSLKLSFGCMGANMQPQGQVQILVNFLDRGINLQ